MRTVTLCAVLALAAPVPAAGASLTASAKSGVKTKVSQHAAFDRSCTPQHVVVRITTPPANGTATTAEETLVMPEKTKLGGVQRCAGKSGPNAVIYYESRPGFRGGDSFKYQRTNEDDPMDRLNGEITMTVSVK
jgi:hypothetical protein